MLLPVGPVAGHARRRHEALAVLAGRLRNQLLDPEAEDARVRKADLVAAVAPALAEREPELEPRVALVEAAGVRHLDRAVEQALEVDARRAPPGRARTATAPSSGRRSSARPGRRRRSCARCASSASDEPGSVIAAQRSPLRRELPEVVGVRPRLERGARLRGGDEERALEGELRRQPPDRAGVRRVEDVQRSPTRTSARMTSGASDEPPMPSSTTASASAEHLLPEPEQRLHVVAHPRGLVEPPEPAGLVLPGPDGRVARPDACNELAPLRGHVRAQLAPPGRDARRSAPRTRRRTSARPRPRASRRHRRSRRRPSARSREQLLAPRRRPRAPCRREPRRGRAKASRVSSGIVFTVSGPISSSTYITSRYAGFLVEVEAQSGRCTCAPASARRSQTGPAKASWKCP